MIDTQRDRETVHLELGARVRRQVQRQGKDGVREIVVHDAETAQRLRDLGISR